MLFQPQPQHPQEFINQFESALLQDEQHQQVLVPQEQPAVAKQRRQSAGNKPNRLSLASLIGQAIMAQEMRQARLSTIYQWIADTHPQLYRLSEGGWQVRSFSSLILCRQECGRTAYGTT